LARTIKRTGRYPRENLCVGANSVNIILVLRSVRPQMSWMTMTAVRCVILTFSLFDQNRQGCRRCVVVHVGVLAGLVVVGRPQKPIPTPFLQLSKMMRLQLPTISRRSFEFWTRTGRCHNNEVQAGSSKRDDAFLLLVVAYNKPVADPA
jgi:hypothetical protein